MATRDVRDYWDSRGLVLLWLAFVSGPAAWALNQLIGYALVKPACRADGTRFIHLGLSGATLLLTILGGSVALSCLLQLRRANPTGSRRDDRSQLLAISGVGLNALLALLIVTAAIAQFLLGPCD